MRVPAAGADQKFVVFGGLDDAAGRLTGQTAAAKDSTHFVRFLDHRAGALPEGPVVVVLDTVGDHKSHAARRWWIAHRDRIRPRWLPAYAPELNRIERVWRHFKDKLSNHRWWADLPARERATATLLDRMEAQFHRPEGITLRPSKTSARLLSGPSGCSSPMELAGLRGSGWRVHAPEPPKCTPALVGGLDAPVGGHPTQAVSDPGSSLVSNPLAT
jgi:hypothetical protein